METEPSVTDVNDTEGLNCGVWISFGDSGSDDLVISCWSDCGEWASSTFKYPLSSTEGEGF